MNVIPPIHAIAVIRFVKISQEVTIARARKDSNSPKMVMGVKVTLTNINEISRIYFPLDQWPIYFHETPEILVEDSVWKILIFVFFSFVCFSFW